MNTNDEETARLIRRIHEREKTKAFLQNACALLGIACGALVFSHVWDFGPGLFWIVGALLGGLLGIIPGALVGRLITEALFP